MLRKATFDPPARDSFVGRCRQSGIERSWRNSALRSSGPRAAESDKDPKRHVSTLELEEV